MMDTFKNHLHLPVTKIDDSKRMLARLKVWHSASSSLPAQTQLQRQQLPWNPSWSSFGAEGVAILIVNGVCQQSSFC